MCSKARRLHWSYLATLATCWRAYRVIDPTPREPESLAAALLAGRDQSDSLIRFAGLVGAQVTMFAHLPLLEQAYRLSELESDTFGHATAAIRLTDRLSPDPANGAAAKVRLLERLRYHVEAADAHAILTLRNLELNGFPGHGGLWEDVQRWAETNSYPAAQDSALVTVIGDAVAYSSVIAPWREAITHGLRAASQRVGGGFASGFWRWIELKPSLLGALAGTIKIDQDLEARIANAAPPSLRDEAALALLRLASEQHLPELHGIAASTVYPVTQAARAQIKMEGANRSGRGPTLA